MAGHSMPTLSILFVTSRFPLPLLTGDRARAFHQLRLLSRRHRITLVTYAEPNRADQAHAMLDRFGVRVVAVPFTRAAAAWRLARHAWSDLPLQAAPFDSPQMSAAIRSAVADERFDLAHIQLARTYPLVGRDLGLPRVVDLVDALSLNMRRRAAHDRTWLGWAARVDASRLQRYERRICTEAAATLVVAGADRDAIGAYANMSVNPNGVDLSAFPRVNCLSDRHRLVFTGNLGYFPNVDAVCWFADHVLPLVWREEPRASLTIAGARPHRRVKALAQRDARITVTGRVPHLHPYLAAARVSVAPMRAGSGQLLKVLEAMSTGTPVVTTSRGLSGIDARDGEHALVADTADRFAAHVVSLIRDDRLAHRLATAGHALVEREYTWERSVAELEAIYLKVAASARTEASCA
jgi:sugar transferase (PEP-CTERM/EpsH1 system associated)